MYNDGVFGMAVMTGDITHNHEACIRSALEQAESVCRRKNLRFTDLRRRVLRLVWSGHKPLGAYDILAMLEDEGRPSAPPTVYRTLEFLIEAGLVHRLDSLNAYIGCPEPGPKHSGHFLICERCRTVIELDDDEIATAVARRASAEGFRVARQTLEIQGCCEACRDAAGLA